MTEPKRYRRRPETVEAIQYDGTEESRDAILQHFMDSVTLTSTRDLLLTTHPDGLIRDGNWIVRYNGCGLTGTVHRYDADHFDLLFDEVVPVRVEPDCGCCD